MPWQEVDSMKLREELVREYQRGRADMTELARAYGVSRKTAYKWVERYEQAGVAGLADRSRRPHGHPATTAPAIVDALLALHERFPHWSPGKLLTFAQKHAPRRAWPSRSVTYTWFQRHGLTRPAPRPPVARAVARPERTLAPAGAPNDLWTTDFKGRFRTQDHRYCNPLTVRDAFSRYVLGCEGLAAESEEATRPAFVRVFRKFGLPTRLRMDNGRPFASPALGGLTRLSVWWIRLGIVVERITPGRPDQNGSHEQFHGVLKRHTARPPAATAALQQRRFNAFCTEYNHERPHDALGGDVPAKHYRPASRPYPERVPPLEYPGAYEVRRVSQSGMIGWLGRSVFVSEALRGECVGLEEVDEGWWTLWFGPMRLAQFDVRRGRWC
jgi:transposase InsO family protein